MVTFLPFIFLAATASIFGLSWIIFEVDPETAKWYFFALFVLLLFLSVFSLLGIILYFIRSKLFKRASERENFDTSFKISFLIGFFLLLVLTLAILKLVNLFNVLLSILAVSFIGAWSYLGKGKR